MTAASGTYPAHWEADVVLRDGSTMHIRPIRPEDAGALQRFHLAQSPESTYLRFFAPMGRLSETDLERFTRVDHRDRVALVLVHRGEIIAVGRFDRFDQDTAEVAFNVADRAQGKGLGSVLLEHLTAAGRELGVRRFVADVLPRNAKMMRVFADAGYDVHSELDDGILAVSFTIQPTDRSLAVLAEREQRAEALSMAALLEPASVLLVCAGAEGEAFGRMLLAGLQVPEVADAVQVVGLPGYPQAVTDLPPGGAGVDLALIAAPAATVLDLLAPLAQLGVRGVVLYTGGFASASQTGRISQRTLVRRAREHGLRVVGPRSYGLIGSTAAGRLDLSLYPDSLRAGPVGIFCQSAAGGRAVLGGAAGRDLGISSFLSAGHRVDVSGNDAMQHWLTDAGTEVVVLRLESIGNPRKFSRIARRLSRKGPVIASFSGITGQLNPPGHEVRTSTEPRAALEELMHQSGVLMAQSIGAALDLSLLLSEQPRQAGARVLVLTNSGSQVAVAGELLRAGGLAPVGQERALSPTAGGQQYCEEVDAALARDDWDVCLVGYVPLLSDDGAQVAAQTARLAAESGRTTVACIEGLETLHPALQTHGVRVPAFSTVQRATTVLAQGAAYQRWLERDHGHRVEPDGIDRYAAKRLVHRELLGVDVGTTRRLPRQRGVELLGAYGVETWPEIRVSSLQEALAAADELGWPVALKTSDDLLRHRLDLGGVRLDLAGPEDLTQAFTAVQDRMRSVLGRATALDVQAMAPTGTAAVVRAVEDALYGPIVTVGMSGDASELLGDVSYGIPPLTDVDLAQMVRSLKASPRLFGHRGLPVLDTGALEELLGRVSTLKEDLAEVHVLELNPVLVGERGLSVLGAWVDLAHPRRGDVARRALPA